MMTALLLDPHSWITLLVLTFLEIVLGGDNIVFITLACEKLPHQQQALARRIGLFMAMISRLVFLAVAFTLAALTEPLFYVLTHAISSRDLIFLMGGLFLIYKSLREMHDLRQANEGKKPKALSRFALVIIQIMIIDIVFSIDSVITAVGIANHYIIMATAIIIAVLFMMLATDYLSDLIKKHATIKVLAFCFLLLIGIILTLEGLNINISHNYLYVCLGFAIFIQLTQGYCKIR
jgi:predicted tellurium resistance membrane protein TerC